MHLALLLFSLSLVWAETKESLRCFTFNVAAYESDLSVEEESPLSLVIRINKTSEIQAEPGKMYKESEPVVYVYNSTLPSMISINGNPAVLTPVVYHAAADEEFQMSQTNFPQFSVDKSITISRDADDTFILGGTTYPISLGRICTVASGYVYTSNVHTSIDVPQLGLSKSNTFNVTLVPSKPTITVSDSTSDVSCYPIGSTMDTFTIVQYDLSITDGEALRSGVPISFSTGSSKPSFLSSSGSTVFPLSCRGENSIKVTIANVPVTINGVTNSAVIRSIYGTGFYNVTIPAGFFPFFTGQRLNSVHSCQNVYSPVNDTVPYVRFFNFFQPPTGFCFKMKGGSVESGSTVIDDAGIHHICEPAMISLTNLSTSMIHRQIESVALIDGTYNETVQVPANDTICIQYLATTSPIAITSGVCHDETTVVGGQMVSSDKKRVINVHGATDALTRYIVIVQNGGTFHLNIGSASGLNIGVTSQPTDIKNEPFITQQEGDASSIRSILHITLIMMMISILFV
ncbi:hypothetical protein PROFUN_04710 [Planoprotostelium fungivorum]|uniref:IgGFc-binding protein N-terminal domain-containing protein n=1 Tax=Planoprotostelium fungivorum TaxID=1890364 RepID=A0A2P6NFV5_9EUKA|nr:hypothetical protein PROFUN_04710 [Planoprotostelium fungivorum]